LCTLQYTARDGGYTATDYVLRQLRHAPHCAWLSITNGDNAYGSEVVSAVRQRGERGLQEPQGHLRHQRAPQMLLAPLDSRNFAALGECIILKGHGTLLYCITTLLLSS
jgi:hypothetical protein